MKLVPGQTIRFGILESSAPRSGCYVITYRAAVLYDGIAAPYTDYEYLFVKIGDVRELNYFDLLCYHCRGLADHYVAEFRTFANAQIVQRAITVLWS